MKTKELHDYLITVQLIFTFVFAYAKSRFSHGAAQMHLLIKPCYVSALQLEFFQSVYCFTVVFSKCFNYSIAIYSTVETHNFKKT